MWTFGTPIQDLTELEKQQILELSQGEEAPDFLEADQYRVLATRLDSKKHCVYLLSPLPKKQRKQLKSHVINE